MSESIETLQRKISSAEELKSVVRTMKALAAASILQYERAIRSLTGYYRAVELGLAACCREASPVRSETILTERHSKVMTGALVFGSDQGLVGQFNDQLASFVAIELERQPGAKIAWAVGERIYARLQDAGFTVRQLYPVPNSVSAITPLISQILVDNQTIFEKREIYIFHNRPRSAASYEPAKQRLLPLDQKWQRDLGQIKWPTNMLPQVIAGREPTVLALVREYLFVSLFKACAESLASENASRLAFMQRAERNIGDLLEQLRADFHQQRQNSIDAELFDLISGFEVLGGR
jgi:F-type H+-transporting ATPase subunit gamma